MAQGDHLRRIRFWLAIFMAGLIVSGATAFPLQTELSWIDSILGKDPLSGIAESTRLLPWIRRVSEALTATNASYPFLAYGTDWLAFAHLVIAIVFIGPYVDPVRNKWVVAFGLIACTGVLPLALVAGHMREIPLSWRLVDCSFGVFGAILIGSICRIVSSSNKRRPENCACETAIEDSCALPTRKESFRDKEKFAARGARRKTWRTPVKA